jgi:hypothetical protein
MQVAVTMRIAGVKLHSGAQRGCAGGIYSLSYVWEGARRVYNEKNRAARRKFS